MEIIIFDGSLALTLQISSVTTSWLQLNMEIRAFPVELRSHKYLITSSRWDSRVRHIAPVENTRPEEFSTPESQPFVGRCIVSFSKEEFAGEGQRESLGNLEKLRRTSRNSNSFPGCFTSLFSLRFSSLSRCSSSQLICRALVQFRRDLHNLTSALTRFNAGRTWGVPANSARAELYG